MIVPSADPRKQHHVLAATDSLIGYVAAGQRDAAEKRLKNLERLLIRADTATTPHQVGFASSRNVSPNTAFCIQDIQSACSWIHVRFPQMCMHRKQVHRAEPVTSLSCNVVLFYILVACSSAITPCRSSLQDQDGIWP